MKHTQKFIKEMYKYAKSEFEGWLIDIFEVMNAYRDIAEEFDLTVAFWIDWCEYTWDDEIYCYLHVNWIGSIVFDRWVKRFTDEKDYKDAVDYILKLEEQAEEISNKIENLEKENESLKYQLKTAKEYLHSDFSF